MVTIKLHIIMQTTRSKDIHVFIYVSLCLCVCPLNGTQGHVGWLVTPKVAERPKRPKAVLCSWDQVYVWVCEMGESEKENK